MLRRGARGLLASACSALRGADAAAVEPAALSAALRSSGVASSSGQLQQGPWATGCMGGPHAMPWAGGWPGAMPLGGLLARTLVTADTSGSFVKLSNLRDNPKATRNVRKGERPGAHGCRGGRCGARVGVAGPA
jgi:hypothetical protein